MNLRTVLTVNAVVAALFGLSLVLMPDRVLGYYAMEASATSLLLARFLGAENIGFAAVTWLLRSAGDPESRRGLVLGLFIGWGVGFVVSFIGLSASPLGWLNMVIYGVFTLAYGYFQFTTPGMSMPRPMSSTMNTPPPTPAAAVKPARRKTPARRTPARRK